MKRKKGDKIELKIDGLVYGGRGIGELDGWRVFVDGVVPGDRVRARLTKVKAKYGEARLEEVLTEGGLRIAPRCKHFGVCGGCKWQFLDYEEQLRFKEEQVRDAVERLGGLDAGLVKPIVGCDEPWFYRNKMELSFGESDDGEVMLGFYPPGYHYEVFNLDSCFLQSDQMEDFVRKVRDWANEHGLKAYHKRTHEGLLRNLIIREGKNTGEVMVILVTSTEEFGVVDKFVELFADDERVTSLYWNSVHQVKGQKTWVEEKLLAGKEVLREVMEVDGQRLEFDIRPQAFFQTNTKQAEVLYGKVLELAGLSGDEVVWDLYCGTGTIGLFCAGKAGRVVGIEVNESAVENARGNAVANGIENAEFHLGTVEEVLGNLKEKPDVVIVDPPRAGLGEKVVGKTAAFGAERIVYVSCNPTTMARDFATFEALGYKVREIWPVDMFPQTGHVECVGVLLSGRR